MAKAGTVGRIAARLLRVPLVVHTYHGHVFHSYFGPRKTRLFLAIERTLGRMTDRIVVVGDRQRDEIVSFGVASPAKLLPIRLGLELEPFLTAEAHRGELRAELGLDASTPLVGIVARLVPIKAHEDFFQAALRVRAAVPGTRFLVVGDGERRAELEGLVHQLGLGPDVRFLGWRGDLPRIYADLDVVALTSHNEGSPVALIEASAAARPIASTAVGGVGEVVLDGRTGRTVPPRQPGLLADAIVALLHDRAAAERMGAAARHHVYPRYSNARLIEDVRDLYRRELARRGRALPPVPHNPTASVEEHTASPGVRA
jgi:glycosyltransferase involved in cell wall biosynthesis